MKRAPRHASDGVRSLTTFRVHRVIFDNLQGSPREDRNLVQADLHEKGPEEMVEYIRFVNTRQSNQY